jgi:hypothetical protein
MNRTIWFLWFQGIESAPPLVKRCYESWVANNPGWNVTLLDHSNLNTYVLTDLESGNLKTLSPNCRADLVRLEILARHGGVWVDATCYCALPLDSWLSVLLPSGFFAFERRSRWSPPIASWFLAALPSNPIVEKLHQTLLPYWRDHSFHNEAHPVLFQILRRGLGRHERLRRLWFSGLVRDRLSLTPYFAFHYALGELVRTDPECSRIWGDAPHIFAKPSLLVQRDLPLSADLRDKIDCRSIPVHKLSWKFAPTEAARYLIGDIATSYQSKLAIDESREPGPEY